MTIRIVPLLLCGGGGTRLWPLSTDENPKQFLRLFGERSLFQETLLRARAAGAVDAVVIGAERHDGVIREEVAALGADAPRCTVLLEPDRRDSAAAIAAGTALIARRFGPEAIVLVLPCDHRIPNHADFAVAVDRAARTAAEGHLVTFGITPLHPATGYGYIMRGEEPAGPAGAHRAAAFVEKPDHATALGYLNSGKHFWNSGMFVFRADVFAAEAGRLMPAVFEAAARAVDAAEPADAGTLRLDGDAFRAAPRISIDYALFETSDRVALLPVSFAWSDVGAWDAVYDASEERADGNVLVGNVVVRDVRNSLLRGEGIAVRALGLDGVVVVATPEGVLVVDKARAGEIKALLG